MSKLLTNRKALMNMVRRIAIEAGNITLKHFDDAGYHGADAKADGSPVTKADREAEAYIEPELKKILPEIIMVGEESALSRIRPDLSQHEYFWLVDPLDGTTEFISGSGEYTVNIALIHNRKPVLGVIYAPVPGEMYAGYINPDGESEALIWKEDSGIEKSIHVRTPPNRGLIVVASKNHGDKGRLDKFLEDFKIEKLIKKGSSLKICSIAAGKADLYARFGLTCEWDTAAGHAILRAAGGDILKTDGSELLYGGDDPKFLNPEFIASGFDWRTE